ncbi:MAG: YeeE/YedE family protein [Deltaproteobacteria bacterium]|nr:YeeE/YedE family protein [Deltaproteobacteria bacterium]MBN2671644.1 YeeE/YedE family protein [Deltaproteobacteria bacterium]
MIFSRKPKEYINPYLGGTLLGVVLFLAFYITGNGLGASGAINRVMVAILELFAPSHVDHVGYLAHMGGGTSFSLENSGVAMLLGTILGGFASGLFNGRVKVEIRKGPSITPRTRIIMALLGGLVMGYGARLARGCTSGQALSGGAVLSVGSFAFMFSIFIGAYALAYFVRRLWN